MNSQSNQPPELNRAGTSETSMNGDDRLETAQARLDELLEQGEISAEAFAEYSATADAALSLSVEGSGHKHNSTFSALLDRLDIEQTTSIASFSVWGNFALTQTDDEHPIARRVQIAFTAPTTPFARAASPGRPPVTESA